MSKNQNLRFLQSYVNLAKADVKPKVIKVNQLFKDRLIRNFETAKTILETLVSSHKSTVKSGLTMYDKALVKYENAAPVGKPVELKILGRPTKQRAISEANERAIEFKNKVAEIRKVRVGAASKIGKYWKTQFY